MIGEIVVVPQTERDGLRADGIDRAVIELRLLVEPHEETLEHQVECIGVS